MEPEPLDQSSSLYLDANEAPKETVVWQRGGRGSEASRGTGGEGDVLTKEFLRKYIHYARNRVKPVLSAEAMEAISSAYAEMRSKQTPKSLETIIRLASAHAKSRLSSSVEEVDVDEALDLMNFVLFHEIGDFRPDSAGALPSAMNAGGGKRLRVEQDGEVTSGEEEDDEVEGVGTRRRRVGMDDDEAITEINVNRESARYQRLQSVVMKLGSSTGEYTTLCCQTLICILSLLAAFVLFVFL
ncbi:MCM3 [Symbiodinium microadriaticum]|nr:MCM3 [Symbiodinium microadriaticum]